MPPGLRPPPSDGRLTLGLHGGVPRLETPTQRHIQYRSPANYQPGYAGYYGYTNSGRYQRQNPVSYRNSRYPYFQKQWYSKRYYPASRYSRRGVISRNKFQRRYRQTENERRINRGKVNDNKKSHLSFNFFRNYNLFIHVSVESNLIKYSALDKFICTWLVQCRRRYILMNVAWDLRVPGWVCNRHGILFHSPDTQLGITRLFRLTANMLVSILRCTSIPLETVEKH